MVWGALIGLAGSYLMGNQQKKANQASINAMSDIANRPQKTQLGSFFNPSGTSGLAPMIGQGRADIFAGFPGYKSTLQGATNTFLRNLGGIRNELTGGGPIGGGGYNPIQMDPTAMFGSRPTVGAMPVMQNYLSGGDPMYAHDISRQGLGGWGYKPKPSGYTPQEFDAGGFGNAMSQYQAQVDAQRQYDQNVANYNAQIAQGAPTGAPGTPTGSSDGLNSDFMQAALNPLKEAAAQQYDFLQRDMGRRGLSGSSLANNQLTNLSQISGRQISDATANIRQKQLAQLMGIDEAALNASTGLINNLGNLDKLQLNELAGMADEELRMLGLSGAQTNALMAPFQMAMQSNNQYYGQLASGMMGAGSALGGGGTFFPSTENAMQNGTYIRGSRAV